MSSRPTYVRRAGMLLALALAACGGSNAARRGEDPESLSGLQVESVDVAGNQKFDDDEILGLLEHHPPTGIIDRDHSRFDRLALAVDRKRIVSFYKERGFFSAKVPDVDINRLNGGVGIRFHVEEGEPSKIAGVRIDGVPEGAPVDARALFDDLGVEEGKRFVHEDYLEAKKRLARELAKAGWAHAEVRGQVRVDRDRQRAEVLVRADTGPLVRLGEPTIDAQGERIPEETIRARVAWREGDRFDPEKLEETVRRVRLLEVSSVTIDVEHEGQPEVVSPVIKVTTGKPREIKAGGGVLFDSVHYEGRVRGGYRHRGFLHPLLTFRAEGRLGLIFPQKQLVAEAEASLQRHDFLVPLLELTGTVALRLQDYEAYTTIGPSGGAVIARPFFGHRLQLAGGWNLSVYDINPRDAMVGEQLEVSSPQAVGFFHQSATVDLRDDRIQPRNGLLAELRVEEGGPYAAGELEYFRTTGHLRLYRSFGDLVLTTRARAGLLRPSGDEDPITRRFFAGGPSSHRGFNFRRLSPSVVNEKGNRLPVGGDALFLASADARYPIWHIGSLPLALAVFADAGDVTADPGDLDLTRLHYAVGLGLRLQTPVGAIRIEGASRLNRLDTFEPDGRLNPSPGQRFAGYVTLGEAY